MEDEGLIVRLRLLMKARKIGQKALSAKAGLNDTYVRDILKGKSRNPRNAHLQKLALALECHVSDLTGELEPPDDGATPNPKRELFAVIDEMDAEEQETLLRVALGLRKPRRSNGPDPPRPFVMGGRVTENQTEEDCASVVRLRTRSPERRR
jgi:transcriptional regulator with XRE-family HTH domain